MHIRFVLVVTVLAIECADGFLFPSQHVKVTAPPSPHSRCARASDHGHSLLNPGYDPTSSLQMASVPLSNEETTVALWVLAFASSHIGMSATRSTIIASLGEVASALRLVGRDEWKLPAWWPGDSSGGDRLFPDTDTTGRQVYRAGYTAISFATLGSAFAAYLSAASSSGTSAGADAATLGFIVDGIGSDPSSLHSICMGTAALSFGASIASLFNASPLGLMPSFEAQASSSSTGGQQILSSTSTPGDTLGGIRRDDSLKFTAKGLTRITRHPLILPVVPWGIATSYLAGNRPCDYILFGGLALYAIAGCFAQDLRVIREEGSVGTVFKPTDSAEEGQQLNSFFQETSFVPFKAVVDGRQNFDDVVAEVPWLGFVVGTGLGWLLEEKILQLLNDLTI